MSEIIGVIGAGAMGRGIAQLFAQGRHKLRLLQRATGDPRYRPSQWLRRRALLGVPLA